MVKLYKKICDFNLAQLISQKLKKIDSPFWSAFIASFLLLNLIFIYHSAHFLFGDHDWTFLKKGIPLSAGLFEGRFTQFLLINMLSMGEILPIINNVIGFTGYCLGIALLARYWQIPHNKQTYILFALFCTITPYILSFMYFAFLVAPVLSWNAFVIAALIISEKETVFSIKKSCAAIFFITLALGGYPPVINLIAVAFTARLLLLITAKNVSLKTLIKNYHWTVINIIVALGLYKLCLWYFTKIGAINSNYYNLQTTPFSEWRNKVVLVIKDIFLEFGATLPFITASYKDILFCLTILALISIIIKKENIYKKIISSCLFFAIFLAAMVTLFLSTSLKETEFSPRIDFFGYMYANTAMLAILLQNKQHIFKNLAYIFVICNISISSNTLFEAQKVWKLGFDAELSLYRRISKRFHINETFNPDNRYIIVQGGSPAFRSRFYHTPYKYESDDLLGISYVPGMASGVMWNYYGLKEYADTTSYVYTFRPDAVFKEKLINTKPWPAKESIAVGGYWIMINLNQSGIDYLRQRYL